MSAPPVVVTFALPEESSDFRYVLRGRKDGDVRVEHIGVGPVVAAERMARLLAAVQPRVLICTGFAGGLDPRLALGDLVVAENLSTPEIFARGRALAHPRCEFGGVISRGEPVESVADKAALFRESGALAVDMESETVAAACRAAGVPVLVVRTISDPAGAALPVPFGDWFDVRGQKPRVLGLVKYLALHPGRIGPFAGFVRGLAPARRALADFLVRVVEGAR